MDFGLLTNSDRFFEKKTNITQNTIISCTFCDGNRVFLGSLNGTIRGWSLTLNKLEGTFSDHSDLINGMAMLNDGTMISASDDCSLLQWSTRSYDKIRKFEGPEKSVTCCAVMYNQEVAASFKVQKNSCLIFAGAWEGRVYIWSPLYLHPFRVLIKHPAPIKKIIPLETSNGPVLVSGCHNGDIWIWSLTKFTTIHKVKAHTETICDLKFYNGALMSSSSKDRKLKIWKTDLNLIKEIDTGVTSVNKFNVFRKQFFVVVNGLKTAEVWDNRKKVSIDKCESTGIISDIKVLDQNTLLVTKSYEVKLLKYVNVKKLLLKLLHNFRAEMGYPPVIVKLVCESIITP